MLKNKKNLIRINTSSVYSFIHSALFLTHFDHINLFSKQNGTNCPSI